MWARCDHRDVIRYADEHLPGYSRWGRYVRYSFRSRARVELTRIFIRFLSIVLKCQLNIGRSRMSSRSILVAQLTWYFRGIQIRRYVYTVCAGIVQECMILSHDLVIIELLVKSNYVDTQFLS